MASKTKYVKPIIHGHNTRKHGQTPTYSAWCAMITRCTNPNQKQYKDYGGRGITFCDEWKDFRVFLADMGEKPSGATLDRIDNEKGYSPTNCRWATMKEQARNNRHNRIITYQGRNITLVEFSEITGLKRECLAGRLRRGWTVEDAAAIPILSRGRHAKAHWKRLAVQEEKK